jgi:hypothetical protein
LSFLYFYLIPAHAVMESVIDCWLFMQALYSLVEDDSFWLVTQRQYAKKMILVGSLCKRFIDSRGLRGRRRRRCLRPEHGEKNPRRHID